MLLARALAIELGGAGWVAVLRAAGGGQSVSAPSGCYQGLFPPWLPPRVASLAFAIAFVLLWYGILLVLYRRKIFLKV